MGLTGSGFDPSTISPSFASPNAHRTGVAGGAPACARSTLPPAMVVVPADREAPEDVTDVAIERILLGQGTPETADATTVSETLVERDLITSAPCHETSQGALAAIDSTVGSNE